MNWAIINYTLFEQLPLLNVPVRPNVARIEINQQSHPT